MDYLWLLKDRTGTTRENQFAHMIVKCLSLAPRAVSGAAVPTKPASEAEGTVSVSSMASLTDGTTVPVSLLATPNQTSLGSLGHGEDLAPNAASQPQHSR